MLEVNFNDTSHQHSPTNHPSGEIIKATMKDIGSVITNFFKDPTNSQYLIDFKEDKYITNISDPLYWEKFALSNLSELFLHNFNISGDFEFSVHDDGQFIVDVIKKYKPLPIKQEYPFVVEM